MIHPSKGLYSRCRYNFMTCNYYVTSAITKITALEICKQYLKFFPSDTSLVSKKISAKNAFKETFKSFKCTAPVM